MECGELNPGPPGFKDYRIEAGYSSMRIRYGVGRAERLLRAHCRRPSSLTAVVEMEMKDKLTLRFSTKSRAGRAP